MKSKLTIHIFKNRLCFKIMIAAFRHTAAMVIQLGVVYTLKKPFFYSYNNVNLIFVKTYETEFVQRHDVYVREINQSKKIYLTQENKIPFSTLLH